MSGLAFGGLGTILVGRLTSLRSNLAGGGPILNPAKRVQEVARCGRPGVDYAIHTTVPNAALREIT